MAGQVAIACVLLIGALLLGRSFRSLLTADRGYDPSGIPPAQFEKLMVAEQKRWGEIIKAAGITAD